MRNSSSFGFLLFLLIFFCLTFVSSGEEFDLTTPSVTKIWSDAPHNAFTDLIWFKGKFYCTFREGTGHVPGKITGSGDGTVRILVSNDGREWKSSALLKKKTFDLRDSKISVTPDGRLMIVMGGSVYINGKLTGRVTQVSFSDTNGENFSVPESVRIDPSIRTGFDWLWRVTWHEGIGYGVVYQLRPDEKDWRIFLLKTTNGIDYQCVSPLNVTGKPNESTVRFDPTGKMNILVRREADGKSAWLGRSIAPFTQWQWTDLGESLGGPNLIWLPNGKPVLGGRVKGKTGIGTLDENGKFKLRWILPSAGDNSYPGFLVHNNRLWISWYSSHEGKTCIYFTNTAIDQ